MKVSAYSSDSVDLNNLSASTNALVSPSKVNDYQDFFNTTCKELYWVHLTEFDITNVLWTN